MDTTTPAHTFCGCMDNAESPKDRSCCPGKAKADGLHPKMCACLKKCRWAPLLPVVIGAIFLSLGYFLSAEIIQTIWIVLAALGIALGVAAWIVMMRFSRNISKDNTANR